MAIAATVVSAAGQAAESLGIFGKLGIALVAVAINALICLVAFRVTTARQLTYRQVVPGAPAAAVVWQILQWFGDVVRKAGRARAPVTRARPTS